MLIIIAGNTLLLMLADLFQSMKLKFLKRTRAFRSKLKLKRLYRKWIKDGKPFHIFLKECEKVDEPAHEFDEIKESSVSESLLSSNT